jgi:hypothetical protein
LVPWFHLYAISDQPYAISGMRLAPEIFLSSLQITEPWRIQKYHVASRRRIRTIYTAGDPKGLRPQTSLRRMPLSFMMHAITWNCLEVKMAVRARLKRKSYFVDERVLSRAKKALGVKTEAEAIRLSVERVAEMEEFWEFMKKSRQSLRPGNVEEY